MSDFSAITDFVATPYDGGILLSWVAGKGLIDGTGADTCTVTIQYSNNGLPHVTPNTPPYVVRGLLGYQTRQDMVFHRGLINGVEYLYSLFITYDNTGESFGPYTLSAPAVPVAGSYVFTDAIASYSKLGTNTRVSPGIVPRTEVIVWLFPDQAARKASIEAMIQKFSPVHTTTDVLYEYWYVAHTTTEQFNSIKYDPTVYSVQNGVITNIVPTIDSSYNGIPQILS